MISFITTLGLWIENFKVTVMLQPVFILTLAVIIVFIFNLILPIDAANLVDKSTMAYWSFDEGNGKTTKDSTVNNIVGKIESTEWVKGLSGAALKFKGKNSRVVVADHKALHSDTGDLTIQAWINVTSNPGKWTGAGGVVFKQGAYQWCVKKEGVLWFGIWGARLESADKFDFLDHLNEWHHTVVTFEGKNKQTKIYVDGRMVIKGNVNESVDKTADPLYIGFKGDGKYYFQGIIDEVHISNVVRTQAEIKQMMEATLAVEAKEKLPQVWANLKMDN